MTRPIVLLDADGVLADFTGAILETVFRESGTRLTHDDVTTWGIFDGPAFQLVRHVKGAAFRRVAERGGCFSLKPLTGAVEGVALLREIADVHVVTSPLSSSDTWSRERERWLWQHFQIEEGDVIHAHRKHLVRGDFFIDDKPENVVAWQLAHPNGYARLWSAPHNRASTVPRMSCWKTLAERVRGWKP